jgi:hypothetical protein
MTAGLFYGKRINFYVFYHTSIPMVATARMGITKPQLIDFMNNANVAVRSRNTKKLVQSSATNSRRPSMADPPKPTRRPSRDVAPAHLSSKDNDPNPFARKRSSFDDSKNAAGIASGPRKSFDKGGSGSTRKSFDKSSSAKEIPKAEA